MSINVTKQEAKSLAKNLRQAIKEVSGQSYSPSHGHALEILAKTLGFANWDTFCGMAGQDDVPDFAPFTFFCEAFACDDWADGPDWVKLAITPEFIKTILEYQAKAKRDDSEITIALSPEEWDLEIEMELVNDSLTITKSDIWFSTFPRHLDYRCESRPISISALLALAGIRQEKLDDAIWLRLSETAFYSQSGDVSDLAEMLVNAEQLPQSTYDDLDAYYATREQAPNQVS